MSILPEELKCLVAGVGRILKAVGRPNRDKTATELRIDSKLHRSLVIRRDLIVGEIIRVEDLEAIRSVGGIPSKELGSVVGRRLARACLRGQRLVFQDLQ
jgi:N,N'-diacetyllegionaminate synthase